VKPVFAWKRQLTWRGLTLIPLAVLAVSLAFVLSLPGFSAWAAYQSPISPPSAISPLPSQPSVASPTAAVGGAPTPAAGSSPAPAPQTTGGGDGTTPLVAGGIVLAGLIVGAVVLLMRGQPPNEPQEKE
jgi:hypothetical protein